MRRFCSKQGVHRSVLTRSLGWSRLLTRYHVMADGPASADSSFCSISFHFASQGAASLFSERPSYLNATSESSSRSRPSLLSTSAIECLSQWR